ncbi:HET-domain-containing protein [Acephala macrosclerotiorum]|nr:HET-domain-containing protein [Acephala macrosclerotiorum]
MAQCNLCNNLEKRDEDDVRAAFDFTPKELLESTKNKDCSSCTLILEGLRCYENETWLFEHDVRRVYARCLGKDDESLSLEVFFCDDRPKLVLEFFYKDQENQENIEHSILAIKARNSISDHPLSASGLHWATSLLEACLGEHTLCPSNRSVKLTRRILAFDREDEDIIAVRIEEDVIEGSRYIALSHCWGATQTCVTTSQNISEFKNAIPWTALPKTFQDSIVYSLALSVRYLWIDALCILQDDPEDWEIESSKMSDIYRNSFMTLAATASKNGQGGCFPSKKDMPNEYELDSCHSQTTMIMVREKIKHWTVSPTATTLEHHPLLTRGWTFQERILSPRVLHFCGHELVWECKHQALCECGGFAAKQNALEQYSQFIKETEAPTQSQLTDSPSSKIESEDSSVKGDRRFLSEQWHHFVEQYSALNLTHETDRLPALSGLAKRASSVLGVYVAGLWSETFVTNLMWRVDKLDERRAPPTKYIAPSWSWASVNGPATYWPDLNLILKEQLHAIKRIDHIKEWFTKELNRELLRLRFLRQALSRAGTVYNSGFTFLPVGHLVKSASKNPFGSVSSDQSSSYDIPIRLLSDTSIPAKDTVPAMDVERSIN